MSYLPRSYSRTPETGSSSSNHTRRRAAMGKHHARSRRAGKALDCTFSIPDADVLKMHVKSHCRHQNGFRQPSSHIPSALQCRSDTPSRPAHWYQIWAYCRQTQMRNNPPALSHGSAHRSASGSRKTSGNSRTAVPFPARPARARTSLRND